MAKVHVYPSGSNGFGGGKGKGIKEAPIASDGKYSPNSEA